LTFAEQMELKAERAEARAERYENRSEISIERAEVLQQPINAMHGDIAFFAQPNINSSSGRAFTNRRNQMFSAWEKGFEEFKKSEYYAKRAEVARQTAESTKPTDKGFINRRIKDAKKTIRDQKKILEEHHELLEKIKGGQVCKHSSGEVLTTEEIESWIERDETIIENAISKSIYYHECLEEVGKIEFSQDNIKVGYTVKLARWGKCKVIGTGKVNISYEIMTGSATGFSGKAAYTEIEGIVSDKVQIDQHPFNVGDTFTVQVWNSTDQKRVDKVYTVTKVTEEKVTLKSGKDRAIIKKPRKVRDSWAIGIVDGIGGTIYKKCKEKEVKDNGYKEN